MSPLLAHSGHSNIAVECPLLTQSGHVRHPSEFLLCTKGDIANFGPLMSCHQAQRRITRAARSKTATAQITTRFQFRFGTQTGDCSMAIMSKCPWRNRDVGGLRLDFALPRPWSGGRNADQGFRRDGSSGGQPGLHELRMISLRSRDGFLTNCSGAFCLEIKTVTD